MEWRDEAVVLHTRSLGERSHLVSLLTRERGKENGALRASKNNLSFLEMGTRVNAQWKSRLETQLGYWTFEMIHPTAAMLLDDAVGLRLLQCASVMTTIAIPQGHPYPALYENYLLLLRMLSTPQKLYAYVQFEIMLLQELGFGLDLKKCAVTGVTDNLVAVSPRTGRAVSHDSALPYRDRLLPLPSFLTSANDDSPPLDEILQALDLTKYFLERYLLGSLNLKMPQIRGDLKRFTKSASCPRESVSYR